MSKTAREERMEQILQLIRSEFAASEADAFSAYEVLSITKAPTYELAKLDEGMRKCRRYIDMIDIALEPDRAMISSADGE